MQNINPLRLGEMALNDTKPRTATMVSCYLFNKANQILGREPNTFAEAVITLKKHREGGSKWK